MSTIINEPIQTLVHFNGRSLKPVKFKWKNTSVLIEHITTSYQTKNGGVEYLHFAAESQTNLYELVYNLKTHEWSLATITTQL